MRCRVALIASALAAASLPAQPPPVPRAGRVLIRLDLHPTPSPRPASRFNLVPEYRDIRPGEKVGGFLACFTVRDGFFNQENMEKRKEWLEMPLADLPADVRERADIKGGLAYDRPRDRLMTDIDKAARYARVEWNERLDPRTDGVRPGTAELQKLRAIAPVVALRLRGEIKGHEFDRATESVKTLMGLSGLCQTHPDVLGWVVGVEVAELALNGAEELIQQPGCPNLYWPLADLPTPLVSSRAAISGGRVFATAAFNGLKTADRALTVREMDRYLNAAGDIVAYNGPKIDIHERAREALARYAAWAADPARVEVCRKRLVEVGGIQPEAAARFGPLQVVLTDDILRAEMAADDLRRWINLPLWQMSAGVEADQVAVCDFRSGMILAPYLLPPVINIKRVEVLRDQRVAFLRIVEAVRLHAHENGGEWPASLAKIKPQLPTDPVSGKPFDYAVKDGVATLSGSNAYAGRAETNRVYELRIRNEPRPSGSVQHAP